MGIQNICQGGCASGRGKYIYVLYDKFVNFTPYAPQLCFVLVSVLYIFTVQEWLFHCTWIISAFLVRYDCTSYNILWVHMFVCVIQYNCWLYLILEKISYISLMYGLFIHCTVVTFTIVLICLIFLYLSLLRYVGVIHRIFYFVVLHIGKVFVNIFCIYFLCHFCHPRWPAFTKLN